MNLLENKTYLSNLKKCIQETSGILQGFKEKNIMVTGANGLICSAVVDLLVMANQELDLNITIYALGRSVERLEERFSTASAEMCVVPVLYDATKEFSFDKNVDYIIHGASNASPDLYTEKPVETMQGNIYGLTTLLEFSKDKQVERLLYVSSSEVYGDFSTDKPLLETNYGYVDILNPRSSYPMGKRAAETLCVSYLKEYGVESIIVRPGHIYGPSAKREDKRVSSAFVLNALKGEKIIMKSTGSQIRSYTYSLDCATAILQALLKGNPGEAYNISNPRSIISIAEMAKMIAEIGNVELEFDLPTEVEAKLFNPMNNSSLNSEKLCSLGWKAIFDAKDGFKYTMDILAETIQ
ncbi:NAD(P)-dependent oxidoreductase [Enterococcus faecium]|nr:NAD(P)-dependent oxidoreductase [Enterococcus faecium]EGP5737670.1 NAD(P)-dependent oxidoreductase [Enterococcus faecium]EMF0488617.1 NAD(P)-dependent oxidoreductase [Enterococcus faecium]NTQ57064.1 NAD(P)-dependent oxidoreductase [Enterococcus faecium]HAP6128634.1 NAD(P)-dependent oxidoreductase [Enterococcus faecium]